MGECALRKIHSVLSRIPANQEKCGVPDPVKGKVSYRTALCGTIDSQCLVAYSSQPARGDERRRMIMAKRLLLSREHLDFF